MKHQSKLKRLGVNIDHVATIQRLRDTPYPNLVQAANEVVAGGADQITVHLREDRRHIMDRDLKKLKDVISVDLNLEMAVTEEMLGIALKINPFSICLVPEKREERTTEGGLDLGQPKRNELLRKITEKAKSNGILVSYFIEPNIKDVEISLSLGADAVELHTGSFCLTDQAPKESDQYKRRSQEWNRVLQSAKEAKNFGLLVHAGHGIDYHSAKELGGVLEITEYNIGHSIIAEALFCGLKSATRKMKTALGI